MPPKKDQQVVPSSGTEVSNYSNPPRNIEVSDTYKVRVHEKKNGGRIVTKQEIRQIKKHYD